MRFACYPAITRQPINSPQEASRMKVAILLTILVGLALAVLAILQHVDGIITADHVAIAFGVIGLIVFTLGAFMALVRNN
jgi:hypothetical protein